MESLNNESTKTTSSKKAANDTKSAGRPKMKDNNDDNEFATPGLKASFSVESKVNDRDTKHASDVPANGSANEAQATSTHQQTQQAQAPASDATSIPAGGSADKVESESLISASMIEQKLNARLDELAGLIGKAGDRIQRLGEALCRIGDKLEHLPERRFSSKKDKSQSPTVTH